MCHKIQYFTKAIVQDKRYSEMCNVIRTLDFWPLNTYVQKHKNGFDNVSTLGQIINTNLGTILIIFNRMHFFIKRWNYVLFDIDFIIYPFESVYYNKTFFRDKVNLMNIYGWWSLLRFDDHVPENFSWPQK